MTAGAAGRVRPLVAHVVYRFDVGGLENGVVNLINRLPADRFRHAVIALTEVTDFRRRIVRGDVEYLALRKPPGHGLWQLPRWRQVFRQLRPAIVHTRNIGTIEASLAARLAGVPVRIHGEHGWDSADPDGSNPAHRVTRRLCRIAVDHWIALSSHIERYLRQRVGVPPARLTRICNGVDTQRFAPRGAGGRRSIPGSPFQDPRLFVVGTVGRLQAIKDQPNLVRALAHAVAVSPEAERRMRLVIVGDGPDRAAVEWEVIRAGLDRHVWLAGAREDVSAVMACLDVFALPSRAEGISNTILEAMACGLPVVATRVGGTPDLIAEGETGRLVPASDPVALGDALVELMRDPLVAERLGSRARLECERRFSLERMVADYEALYERLLKAGRYGTLALATPGR